MNTENAIKTAVGFFVIIVAGALASAALGGAFAALVAGISPEFVSGMFGSKAGENVVRYSFAVGMIWGLFIGAAASGFACGLAAVIKIFRIRVDYKREQKANGWVKRTECTRRWVYCRIKKGLWEAKTYGTIPA